MNVEIHGLREFMDALKEAEHVEPDAIKKVFKETGEMLVEKAVPKMEEQFVTPPSRRTGALERSVRSLASKRTGRVKEGGTARVAYAGWWEFGTKRRHGGPPPPRAYDPEGRVLFLTYYENQHEVIDYMLEALEKIADVIADGG